MPEGPDYRAMLFMAIGACSLFVLKALRFRFHPRCPSTRRDTRSRHRASRWTTSGSPPGELAHQDRADALLGHEGPQGGLRFFLGLILATTSAARSGRSSAPALGKTNYKIFI